MFFDRIYFWNWVNMSNKTEAIEKWILLSILKENWQNWFYSMCSSLNENQSNRPVEFRYDMVPLEPVRPSKFMLFCARLQTTENLIKINESRRRNNNNNNGKPKLKICRYFCFAIKLVFPHRIRIQWLRSHDIHFVNGGRRKMQETNKSRNRTTERTLEWKIFRKRICLAPLDGFSFIDLPPPYSDEWIKHGIKCEIKY